MKNKIIIHIGAHKTGTTSIQMKLDKDRELLQRKGIFYPKVNFQLHAQHKLAFAMKNSDPAILTEQLQELSKALQAIKNNPLIIISSEEFFTAPPSSIALLKECLSAYDVEILAFIRRQDTQFVSFYNERAKSLGNRFIYPPQRFIKKPIALSEELDYLKFLDQWAAAFGKQKIAVKQYENYPNVVQAFFAHIGHPELYTEDAAQRRNMSVNLEVLEVLRLTKQLTDDVVLRKKILVDAKKFFVDGTPPQKLITSEQRRMILNYFQASNQILFRTYFNQDNQYTSSSVTTEESAAKLKPLDIVRFMLTYVTADTQSQR